MLTRLKDKLSDVDDGSEHGVCSSQQEETMIHCSTYTESR